MREKSCVIIGAGLAGLSAGYLLKKKSWKVAILEARDRAGLPRSPPPDPPHVKFYQSGQL